MLSQDDQHPTVLSTQLVVHLPNGFEDKVGTNRSRPQALCLREGCLGIDNVEGNERLGTLTSIEQAGIVVESKSIAEPVNGNLVLRGHADCGENGNETDQ